MLLPASSPPGRYLAFEELRQIPFLFHLFTTRQCEQATSPGAGYTRINSFLEELGRREPVVSLKQMHGDTIRWVNDRDPHEGLEGDGLLTSVPGLLLGVRTADCVPILLVDCRRRIVGNLHAGWRGTLRGITASAIRQLLEGGSDVADLRVAFGPAIGSCCYQVGPEVVAAFRAEFPGADTFFSRQGPSRDRQRTDENADTGTRGRGEVEKESKFLDLQKANFAQAIGAGLRPHQVFRNAYCTHCDPETFHSYRRDGAKAGRMFALIGIQ